MFQHVSNTPHFQSQPGKRITNPPQFESGLQIPISGREHGEHKGNFSLRPLCLLSVSSVFICISALSDLQIFISTAHQPESLVTHIFAADYGFHPIRIKTFNVTNYVTKRKRLKLN